jgi:hypothetical protein
MPALRDWRALSVDCARKTRLLQANYAKLRENIKKSPTAFEEMQQKYRAAATEDQIAQGEKQLFDEAGLLIPWPVKELYRVRCPTPRIAIV